MLDKRLFDCAILVEVPNLVSPDFWEALENLARRYNLEWGVIENESIIKKIKW